MARPRSRFSDVKTAKRRLRWLIAAFFVALALPIYVLLAKVYAQLENETYFKLRNQAESAVQRLEQRLQEIVASEQYRPIAEYSFFNILENPLLQSPSVKFSPLSEIPPRSEVPGVIGYFQINPDGSFTIPALPDLDKNNQAGLSTLELQSRLALQTRLQKLLATGHHKTETAGNVADKLRPATEKTKSAFAKEQRDHFGGQLAAGGTTQDQRALRVPALAEIEEQAVKTEKKARKLSDEQLRQFNIDTKRWQQKPNSSAEKEANYLSRKETVKLPNQSLEQLFNRAAQSPIAASVPQPSVPAERDAGEQEVTVGQKPTPILSFESEVGPLQLVRLDTAYFCFFRQVWRKHSRYVQGFIVDGGTFFTALVRPFFEAAQTAYFSSVLLAYDGSPLQLIKPAPAEQEILLYRTAFSAPLNAAEIVVNGTPSIAGAESSLVNVLAAALGGILLIGLTLFYRLGVRQIDLAQRQRNFISAVSHELKTPLTSIRMYAEMLRADWIDDPAKKKSYYDFIFFESERLSRLIANVLQLAKLDNSVEPARLQQISAGQLLQRVAAKVAAQIEAAAFQLQIIPSAEAENTWVAVDEDAFAQIVINLVDNALKFSSAAERKCVDLGLKVPPRGQEAIFFVRDYGPGIGQKQMKKIFQLFYRPGDELTRTKPGTGIGLALVQQLAKNMRAQIDVTNRSPGAEFQVKLKTVVPSWR